MNNSAKIIAAAAIGVVAGSVLGLLFAPDKGLETRKKIANEGGKMLDTVKDSFSKEKIARIKEKLENKLKKVNTKMEELSKDTTQQA